MGRFGSSVMDVAYSRALAQWFWIQPNSIEEKIAEPHEIFVEKASVVMLKTPRGRRAKPARIHRGKRGEQLLFQL